MERARPEAVPAPSLLAAWPGHRFEPITLGCSEASVFRVLRGDRVVAYAKQCRGVFREGLRGEIDRLRWLEGRLRVPELLGSGDGAWVFMVTAVCEGVPACDPPHRLAPGTTVRVLASAMRQLHALPTEGCPFDARLPRLLAEARRRVAMGWVDQSDFDPERRGWTAAEVLAEVERTAPDSQDLVSTHGDPCLPNVLLNGERLGGWIDVGEFGVGDRHRDLALIVRSAERNLGAGWGEQLLLAYGGPIDERRLTFYRLLDELW